MEQLHNVAQAAGFFVEVIFTFAGAVSAAGYHYFALRVFELSVLVLKNERDLAIGHRPAFLRAREDDVLHLGAAQRFGALLTQHPAHRIGDIALAGTVGSYNARNTLIKTDIRALRERFEAIDFKPGQLHALSPFALVCPALS